MKKAAKAVCTLHVLMESEVARQIRQHCRSSMKTEVCGVLIGNDEGQTTTVEACSLLTVAEVAAASGLALTTAKPDSDDLYSYCKYTGEGTVNTFVTKSAAAASYFGTVKINKGVAVPGVGDEAFWSEDSFQPGLYFLKGGVLAYISGSVFGPEDPIVALGKLMASRM